MEKSVPGDEKGEKGTCLHEAKDFTTWLENHLDILSEFIKIDLTALEREKSAGAFSADIFAEGEGGESVVIENQLEH